MTDPRVARLGELVVDYSLGLQPGQVLRIDAPPVAAPLAVEVHRAALAAGAHPYVDLKLERLPELLLAEGNDDQLDYVSPIGRREIELVDAIVTIWSESNTRSLTHADPERHQRLLGASQVLASVAGNGCRRRSRWCGYLFPTRRTRRTREMSLSEYERFVFRACHVEGQRRGRALAVRARRATFPRRGPLEARELRIVGPGTDLRSASRAAAWQAADGR